MAKITSEYDENLEILQEKLSKCKKDYSLKSAMQKFNKKVLGYKCKIRELQEDLCKSEIEKAKLIEQNAELRRKSSQNTNFK